MDKANNQNETYVQATSIGQDSHRFVTAAQWERQPKRRLILAGIAFPDSERPLSGNSDADVILHALTNAVSGLTGINILGERADHLCRVEKITDSSVYLQEALAVLGDWQILHASFSVEALRPKLSPYILKMRENLAGLLGLAVEQIGMTATSGEGLSDCGRGEGMEAFCLLSARRLERRGD